MGSFSLMIGSRIHCEGEYGTVLYIGSIEGFEGIWLGVEWDNPKRGKHSGCYKNTVYFTTQIPGAGSFIRISKADTGISCPDAVKLKYGKNDSSKSYAVIDLPQKTGKERHIEMVGMEKIMGKQSNFKQLTDVCLSGMLINGPGKSCELKELVPNVRMLDLSQNLLFLWTDVITITEQLTYLSTLILSKNRITTTALVENLQECFLSLNMIVLNDMSYSWEEILTCSSMWPYVKEMFVLDNNISSLKEPSNIFSMLKTLSLDNNPITNWEEICKIGKLTNLEELHIDNTSLDSIKFPNVSPKDKTDLFPNLKTLLVRDNKLKQWQDISELNKLLKLQSLMINNNPVIQLVSLDTARQLIIAKISGLEVLNRTEIDRSERRGAELDYIKHFHNDWLENGGCVNLSDCNPTLNFLDEHPTYFSLLQKHGAADANEVNIRSALLKDNLVTVKISSPLIPDKPAVTKKLPTEMTVGKLKALVQRIFKIAAENITLTHLFKEDERVKTELDNNLRQLSFYSISNQDTIIAEW